MRQDRELQVMGGRREDQEHPAHAEPQHRGVDAERMDIRHSKAWVEHKSISGKGEVMLSTVALLAKPQASELSVGQALGCPKKAERLLLCKPKSSFPRGQHTVMTELFSPTKQLRNILLLPGEESKLDGTFSIELENKDEILTGFHVSRKTRARATH